MLKKILKFLIPILIIVLSLALARYLYQTKQQKPVAKISERVWQVDTMTATKGDFASSTILYGKVEVPDLYNASAPAFGRVESIIIKEGTRVSKGQLLASMEQTDFLPAIKMIEAKIASFDAQIKNEQLHHRLDQKALKYQHQLLVLGKASLKRTEKLYKQKLAAQSEIDESKKLVLQQQLTINTLKLSLEGFESRLNSLKASREQAEAELVKAQLSLKRSQFYAPFDGVIASVNVAAGEQLSAGKNLFSIYPNNNFEIRAKIPAYLKQRIELDLAKKNELIAYSSKQKFKLLRLSGQASSSGVDAFFSVTASVIPSVTPSVTTRLSHLRPGNIIKLRLLIAPEEPVFKVAYSALYGKNKLYKLVKEDNNITRMQSVEVIPMGDYQAKQFDSLEPVNSSFLLFKSDAIENGDEIIITHLPNALNGLKVKLKK